MLSDIFFKSSSYWTNSSGKKVDLTKGSDLCTENPSQGGSGHTFDFESMPMEQIILFQHYWKHIL